MDEILARVWDDLTGRVTGPMKFRLILQPVMALIFATRAAIRDAREGQPPFLWAVFTSPRERQRLIQSGWKDVGKVFIIAILIDAVYQFIVLRWLYPGETVIVAILLAIVPYLLVRGPLNRILRRGK
ncbi:MAG TPA: hypothetical protein VLU47_14660 [Blastocatellia bacterium]|nr:hypothetical protein [Blastocatellia bacterium]